MSSDRYPSTSLRRAGALAAAAALVLVGCGTAHSSGSSAGTHASLSAASSTVAPAKLTSKSRWVVGYYPIYLAQSMPVSQIPWNDMTHIAVGRVVPQATGTLDTTFDDDPVDGPRRAKQLASAAAAHQVVPILMVGGAGTHDDFMTAINKHQSTLVDNLVGEMQKLGFVGVNLDIEPINTEDEQPILGFVNALRAKDPGIVITVAVAWTTTTFPQVDAYYAQLAQKVDRLEVMTYGMADAYDGWQTWHGSALHGAGDGHPSAVDVSVESYRAVGVPANKISVGIGFYGSCWKGGVTGPRQSTKGASIAADDNVMTYTNIMNNYYSASAYHYDTTAQASYLSFSSPHGPQGCTFLSYEDARSMAAKISYIKSEGLGGTFIWTINEGHDLGSPAGHRDPWLDAVATDMG